VFQVWLEAVFNVTGRADEEMDEVLVVRENAQLVFPSSAVKNGRSGSLGASKPRVRVQCTNDPRCAGLAGAEELRSRLGIRSAGSNVPAAFPLKESRSGYSYRQASAQLANGCLRW